MKKDSNSVIFDVLQKRLGRSAETVFNESELLKYISKKTVSANKGSKSRGSFAALYSLYVLIEDYVNKGFAVGDKQYDQYEGASFTSLMSRQRQLPFGSKLQNHALNSRTNGESDKFFPEAQQVPIVRDLKSQRYWINETLLIISVEGKTYNISETVLEIIDKYIDAKQSSFKTFLSHCRKLRTLGRGNISETKEFILSLMSTETDARLFEIVSFAILKRVYHETEIYWGYDIDHLSKEHLHLYKTGRTNANDGGIDFVMKPLGRFFQATETLDFKKYFLDIDKLEHFPITFVVKSDESIDKIMETIRHNAIKTYNVKQVVDNYMKSIEEIINLDILADMLRRMDDAAITDVLNEIILQSKVEFNQ